MAKEKNDPILGSIVDLGKDLRNKKKSKSKPLASQKSNTLAGSTTFPNCSELGGRHGSDTSSSNKSSFSRSMLPVQRRSQAGKREKFSAKASGDKLKFVRDRKLSANCLSFSHFANGCKCPRA